MIVMYVMSGRAVTSYILLVKFLVISGIKAFQGSGIDMQDRLL